MEKMKTTKGSKLAGTVGLGNAEQTQPVASDDPTTEVLAIIAAILARSRSEIPDMATYAAMEVWKSALERKHRPLDYFDSQGCGVMSPTTEQLAMLAVNLAKSVKDDPKALTGAALRIWFAAGFTLEKHRDEGEYQLLHPVIFTRTDLDENGNILRDSFFKKVVPPSKRSRTYDIGKLSKAFIRHLFRREFNREPTDTEFDDYYGKWNAGNNQQASVLGRMDFEGWYDCYVRETRRAAGKKSATKRKLKKKL